MHTLHELFFAKHRTCYCVCLWSDQPLFCNYFELCANLNCCLKICGECKNFVFGNFGLKILDLKNIPSHTHEFLFLKFNALSRIISFFQKLCFSQKLVSLCLIRSVHSVFRPIEIFLKFLKFERGSFCLFRLVEDDFRLIETHISGFLKSWIGLFQSHYSNIFLLFSLSALAQGSTIQVFVVFLQVFCKVFVLGSL